VRTHLGWLVLSWFTLTACGDSPSPLAGPDGGGGPRAIDAAPGPDAAPVPDDILAFLRSIDGMTVDEQVSELEGYRFFNLVYDQPSDHGNPDGVRFGQRATLLHRDRNAPMVLATSGYYGSPRQSRTELTDIVDGNQLRTEQRFFVPSRPDPADWSHLTIQQAAADHHRLVEALSPYYTGRWVATGASKGGMTSVYHRRFYPDDVDAVVAYVAPNNDGRDDPRYVAFLEAVGTADCRSRLETFQREVLTRRDAMLTRIASQASPQNLTFELAGVEGALESAVLEAPFSFWQYSDSSLCDQLPDASASDAELYQWLDQIAGITYGSDQGIAYFQPYYYQAFTQLGYPAVKTAHLEDLLRVGEIPPERYAPAGVALEFEPESMRDIAAWVASEGAKLMFIYGANDPWTAGAFELGDATDSFRFTVPGGNHGARIEQLPATERAEALAIIGRWLGVSARRLAPGEPADDLRLLRPTLRAR
jgi:hypothetical protein